MWWRPKSRSSAPPNPRPKPTPRPKSVEEEGAISTASSSEHWPKFSERCITREDALAAVRVLLLWIGDDPNRKGLLDTPGRVIRAWEKDWGLGYNKEWLAEQEASILKAQFEDGAEQQDGMILVRKIPFTSCCEHHMALFTGTATVAYIPSKGGSILGLSKLVRIVNMFSRRLQVQERLTSQIADFLDEKCNPIGVGVVITATHSCMTSRGVRVHETDAVTSALRGEMLTKPEVRAEFLKLISL